MKRCGYKNHLFFATVLFCSIPSSGALANDWQPLVGSKQLRDFVSGARAVISVRPDLTAVGVYNADGTASLEAWGETFERTWLVRGEDQVCYSSALETNCYRFERSLSDPGRFRAIHVETAEVTNFHIVNKDSEEFSRILSSPTHSARITKFASAFLRSLVCPGDGVSRYDKF